MKGIAHLLEDYGEAGTAATQITMSDVAVETLRLDAFEEGYQSGWDDAIKAQAADHRRIASDLGQNLADLGFTLQEAQVQVLNSMQPLLCQIAETVLPDIARATLGMRICEQLNGIAQDRAVQAVELAVSPANAEAVQPLIPGDLPYDLRLVELPSLGEGQVYLRFAETEIELNLDEVLQGISTAVSDFFDSNDQEVANA